MSSLLAKDVFSHPTTFGTIQKFAVTVILPAYNEEVSIGSIVLRTRQHADRVLVINDGSTDRTAEVAELADRQIAQRFTGSYAPSGPMTPEVIKHPANQGKGAALRTGFEAAKGADIIVTLDTTGQHDPLEIPRLIAPIQA